MNPKENDNEIIELTDEDVGRAVQRWQRKQLTATGGV